MRNWNYYGILSCAKGELVKYRQPSRAQPYRNYGDYDMAKREQTTFERLNGKDLNRKQRRDASGPGPDIISGAVP